MAASVKRRKAKPASDGLLSQGTQAASAFVSRNPAGVAGTAGFAVALLYVSANALWYQPHAHTDPLFATRAFESFVGPAQRREAAEPQTTIRLERLPDETAQQTPRLSDPVVEKVQRILSDLNFYAGDVDGIIGRNTRQAVEAYQRKMGLTPTGAIDQQLLEQLGAADTTGAITPSPKPQSAVSASDGQVELLKKIQAGLRNFGNEAIEIDGRLGTRTKAAIKEFQSLFGLPATGEPDGRVYAKMKEIKLVK